MKRRMLSVILTLAMVLSLLPATARAEDTTHDIETLLGENLKPSEGGEGKGKKYQLTGDAVINAYIQIETEVELDLNGCSIEREGGATVFYVTDGSLKITGSGNISSDGLSGTVIIVDNSKKSGVSAELAGGTVTGVDNKENDEENHPAVIAQNGASLTISGGVVKNRNNTAVAVGQGSKLTVTSGEITSENSFAIGTNGSQSEQEIKISGGTITGSAMASGIYLPAGTMTVSGENTRIKGGAGIVVRGGTLAVEGGSIEAIGKDLLEVGDARTKVSPNAIAIDKNMGYQGGTVNVTITGGTFSAQNAATVAYTKGNPNPDEEAEPGEGDTVKITGGTFLSADEPDKSVEKYLERNKKVNKNGKITPNNIYVIEISKELEHGTVTADREEAAVEFTVILTVTPAEGYELDTLTVTPDDKNVLDDKTELAVKPEEDGTYTFIMPASDVTVSATFKAVSGGEEKDTYTVNTSVSPEGSGTVTAAPTSAAEGETVKLTVTPAEGYELDALTVTYEDEDKKPVPVEVSGSGNTRTFTMPAGDVTVSATFRRKQSTVTAEKVTLDHETLSLTEGGDAKTLTATVTPAGAGTVEWSVTSSGIVEISKNGNTVTVTAKKTGAATIMARIDGQTAVCTVTVAAASSSTPGGSTPGGSTPDDPAPDTPTPTYLIIANPTTGGRVDGSGTYEKGASVTVRAYPVTGYYFSCWLEAGRTVSTSAVYTFTAAENRTLIAVFEPVSGGSNGSSPSGSSSNNVSYRVVVPTASNGFLTVTPRSAKSGDKVTITAIPNSGFTAGVSVTDRSGRSISVRDSGDDTYTFTMPASQVAVNVTFTAVRTPAPSTGTPSRIPNNTPSAAGTYSFADVPADYAAEVAWAVRRGITTGTGSGIFSPNEPCTRGQILTFIWRSENMPEPVGANPFTDIAPDDYYYKAAMWAYEQGMVSGRTFDAKAPCTRGEAVTYLWQLAWKRPDSSVSSAYTTAFTDIPAFGYASRAIPWAVGKGITTGTSTTTFSPEAVCTRGQIVTFLYRFDMLRS